MVVFERGAGAVEGEAVGLDDDAFAWPAEVELATVLKVIDLRSRQVVIEAELQEQRLESLRVTVAIP